MTHPAPDLSAVIERCEQRLDETPLMAIGASIDLADLRALLDAVKARQQQPPAVSIIDTMISLAQLINRLAAVEDSPRNLADVGFEKRRARALAGISDDARTIAQALARTPTPEQGPR